MSEQGPERLTVDVMVFRDYIYERPGYDDARRLLELHRSGNVELAAAASGYFIDSTKRDEPSGARIAGELWAKLRALFDEYGIRDTAQLAYPGVMVPGENLFPGAAVEGLPEAWNTVLDDWRSHEGKKPKEPADRLHVETHILEGRDVFITNERGLLAMCRRLRDEHAFAVDAMSVSDFVRTRKLEKEPEQ